MTWIMIALFQSRERKPPDIHPAALDPHLDEAVRRDTRVSDLIANMAAGELSRLLDQDGDGGVDEAAERVEQAEIARAQAESDAAEGNRRLQVARQQFAEYAESKATEAALEAGKKAKQVRTSKLEYPPINPRCRCRCLMSSAY